MTKNLKNEKIHKHYQQNNNKRKIITITVIIILIAIITTIFTKINKNTAKTSKIGNNSTSQEIIDYILNAYILLFASSFIFISLYIM